jgi:3-isopropylmalate dehydrogenase
MGGPCLWLLDNIAAECGKSTLTPFFFLFFFPSILSDQAFGLAGGVGIAPSLNAGGELAVAQAVHGTAPDIAGKGIANPSALILSTARLLNWFYQRTRIEACRETAQLFDRGVRGAIAGSAAIPDLGGAASTDAFATMVIAALEGGRGASPRPSDCGRGVTF